MFTCGWNWEYLDNKKDSRGGIKGPVVEGDDGRAVCAEEVPHLEVQGEEM